MFQFFVEEDAIGNDYITITGEDFNHIKNVLRMKVGTEIRVSNKEDVDYLCHILDFF